jgi:hypothetical protein
MNTIIYTGLITVGYSILSKLDYSILLIPFKYFGINIYTVTDYVICNNIRSKIEYSSQIDSNDNKIGLFIGKWYIGNILNDDRNLQITIITSKTKFEELKSGSEPIFKKDIETKKIKIFVKSMSYNYGDYYVRESECLFPNPTQTQLEIVNKISVHYKNKNNNNCVVFINGLPNTGKSMIGYYLAKELNGSYCNSFNPWEPNTHLINLLFDSKPTRENPTIISFDEINVVLNKIHNEKIEQNINHRTSIVNKTGWNNFFDDITIGIYPHIIILMTSNIHPSEINKLDTSYIRNGRVNLFFEMNDILE